MCPIIEHGELQEDVEPRVVAEGKYPLRIVSAKYKESKDTGRGMINFAIAIEGEENAKTLFWRYMMGLSGDSSEYRSRRIRDNKRFMAVFGIPMDADINTDDVASTFEGATGECMVTQVEESFNDKKTGEMINELRLPPLRT